MADLLLERADPADARDEVRFGVLDGRRRVAVWAGKAPSPRVSHPNVAPIALELDAGAMAQYAEEIPDGVRMVEQDLPEEHALYVVTQVLAGLAAMHAVGLLHGAVGERRVVLGRDGRVVLFGGGRTRGGVAQGDVLGALGLLPPGLDVTMPGAGAAEAAEQLSSRIPADSRDRLADWVANVAPELVDEVVPDGAPEESDDTGLLDRYEENPQIARSVDEPGDEDSSTQMNVGGTLWRALVAPLEHAPPHDRFSRVEGRPSEAIQALLAAEMVMALPLPNTSSIDVFVVDTPDADDPDFESSNTVRGPIVDVALAEAALRAAEARAAAGTTLPLPEVATTTQPGATRTVPVSWLLGALLLGAVGSAVVFWLIG